MEKGIQSLTVGEVKELVVKALLSPDHNGLFIQGLFEKGSVLSEKRKVLVDKYNKRKRKLIQIDNPVEQPIFANIDDDTNM